MRSNNKIDVLIFFTLLNRELKSAVKIAKLLSEKYSISCKIGSLIFHYPSMLKYRPKLIVFPTLYDNAVEVDLRPFLMRNSQIKVLNLHQEQKTNPVNEFFLFQKLTSLNNFYHAVWGKSRAEKLKKIAKIDKKYIFVTGNQRLDFLFEKSSISKKDLSVEFNLSLNKKWLLYVHDFLPENENFTGLKLYKQKTSITKEFRILSGQSKKKIIQILNMIAEKFKDSFELIYRLHPGQNITIADLHPNIKIISSHAIDVWLKNVDVVFGWNSLGLIESSLIKKPTFRLLPLEMPKDLDFKLLNYVPILKTSAEVISCVNNINAKSIFKGSKEYRHELNKYFSNYEKGNACEKTAAAIDHILKYGEPVYYKSSLAFSKRYLYGLARTRSKFCIMIGELLKKLNLIEVLHFPRTYINCANDYITIDEIEKLLQ